MVEALKRGDKVITSGGIVGTVERIIDNEKVEVKFLIMLMLKLSEQQEYKV